MCLGALGHLVGCDRYGWIYHLLDYDRKNVLLISDWDELVYYIPFTFLADVLCASALSGSDCRAIGFVLTLYVPFIFSLIFLGMNVAR